MPDKFVRFGIKVWLLASYKSRFIWQMEVYFGKEQEQGLMVWATTWSNGS